MNPEKAVRRGAWVTCGMAGLYVAGALIAPVAGLAMSALFGALGWGTYRRQIWAATTAAIAMTAPIVLVLANSHASVGWAVGIPIQACLAAMPVWAAITLWRHREIARFGGGWLALTLILLVASIAVRPYAVAAGSMANTIERGDYLITDHISWKLGRTPHPGDVVQVRYPVDPKQVFIKRIIGVPGDRLRLVDKQLYRNGALAAEPYAIHATSYVDSYRDNFPSAPSTPLPAQAQDMLQNHALNGEVVVPPGQYFVLGDNRDDSLDSRYFGFVSRADIVGSPVLIYASYDVPPESHGVAGTILNTRWKRLLKRL
jgi:signal peptidase I